MTDFLKNPLPEICLEVIVEEILYVFGFDVWLGARIRALRLISQHTISSLWYVCSIPVSCPILNILLKT